MSAFREDKLMRWTLAVAAFCLLVAESTEARQLKDPEPDAAYKDSRLPVEKRVEDLLRRMTLDEKIEQLHQDRHNEILAQGMSDKALGRFFSDTAEAAFRFSYSFHKVAKDFKEAAAMAIQAGMDMEAPGGFGYRHLPELVKEGKVPIDLIDTSVRRVLRTKFRAGLFDQPARRSETSALHHRHFRACHLEPGDEAGRRTRRLYSDGRRQRPGHQADRSLFREMSTEVIPLKTPSP